VRCEGEAKRASGVVAPVRSTDRFVSFGLTGWRGPIVRFRCRNTSLQPIAAPAATAGPFQPVWFLTLSCKRASAGFKAGCHGQSRLQIR